VEGLVGIPVLTSPASEAAMQRIATNYLGKVKRKIEALAQIAVPQIKFKSKINVLPGGWQISSESLALQ
jgi:hypothetical protein